MLSVLSYKAGYGELYPFFFWRLYAKPHGHKQWTEYRIYTKACNDCEWKRNPVQDTSFFSRNEYSYYLASAMKKMEKRESFSPDKLKRIILFSYSVAPSAYRYAIVKETYDPEKVIENIRAYDTTFIFSFR